MRRLGWTIVASVAVLGGCRHHRAAAPAGSPAATNPILSTRPADDPSLLTLDQLPPPLVLPAPVATTRPAKASPEAIQFYAQGWAARRGGDRANALKYFEKALALDPDSVDVNLALGMMYLAAPTDLPKGQKYLLRAAELNPDDLEVQVILARQYQASNDLPHAIERWRLARQTREYATRNDTAALVDLFLARCLKSKGYDTAALESFQSLMLRFSQRLNVRGNPEMYFFFGRPEIIQAEAGQLYEKLGLYEQAAQAYQAALDRDSDNFEYQAHMVSALIGLKKYDRARALAADLVSRNQASADSVDLLKDVYKRMGKPEAVADELRRLMSQRPADRALLFALADVLGSSSRMAEAQALLQDALAKAPGDPAVVWRLFDLYWTANDAPAAARLVIESAARRPETIDDLDSLWARLVSRSSNKRLQLPALRRLEVPESASASKLYWLARTAQIWSRTSLMRASLEQAVAINPPFAPAYRSLLDLATRGGEFGSAQRQALADRLIEQARRQGNSALADELQGVYLFQQEKYEQAAEAFGKALAGNDRSPSLRYSLAMCSLNRGRRSDAEAMLQKLAEQFPSFAPAQQSLYLMYEQSQPKQADRIVSRWLASDPFSINARLVQVRWLATLGRGAEAQTALTRLFAEEPENPSVLMQMRSFFISTGQEKAYLAKMEQTRSSHPDNHLVATELVGLYLARNRAAEAMAVLDQLRAAVKGDADQLYLLSALYQSVDRRQTTEELLAEVLRLDPGSPAASNDLGYMWAEDGRNLDQAEAMIRTAVQAEPGNAAFLDSLGWLLYKQGKFEEARQNLQKAAAGMEEPDAVVLDHLGDALYRLKQGAEALKTWKQALTRIGKPDSSRPEMARLSASLKQKIASQESGRPAEVAPVGQSSGQARQQ